MKVEVENLGVNYGPVWGIRGVSFNVEADRLAIVGHNGSGKTTLLSILSGLRKPTEGKATINGTEPYLRKDKWVVIRYSFEKPQFSIPVRVRDLVETLMVNSRCPHVGDLVDALGIGEFMDHRLDGLSSGQAQLCNLLMALSCDADVVVLDEPTAHLDSYRAGIIDDLLSKRKGLILATHDPEEGEAVADHFIIMKEGKLVWQGDRKDLFAEGIYEITLTEKELGLPKGIQVVHSFGAIVVARADEELLNDLFRKGVIAGFKRAGLRYAYAESR
ncbi:ATP-binding cassette domain-containing protein [Thermococcus sp. Bubb.Bath]|uniref:ATP-binding cassette domain-containing protein n=1 Tax=Thermococcus sp. Bubb.Bath TaxID=1638242 RepID=UPI001439900B|nr:ABC transporter ATP-binding protein [Thermococcus sp. Bubb.Bath]NJF24846.1 ABC transporter ATP-binding protein [Thermococcus sp. Bubb.Bath]